ncbi:hypothetical protein AB0L40_02475 [Patulibacter sp. NPDC049589]|uniref:hypothetical protein n=1 Tax=Patulibacter sp. NPDC049589 TaxID=3154731 RepID=UPI00342A0394
MLSALWLTLAALAVILAVRVVADRTGQSSAVLLVVAGPAATAGRPGAVGVLRARDAA